MHLVVSWDITDGPDRSAISEKMVEALRAYSWYRPLTTFYIVKANALDREVIIGSLTAISQAHPNRIRFVVSPLMQGIYQGILNVEDWTQINQRTD